MKPSQFASMFDTVQGPAWQASPRSWPGGQYLCTCATCDHLYTGHKLTACCRVCAERTAGMAIEAEPASTAAGMALMLEASEQRVRGVAQALNEGWSRLMPEILRGVEFSLWLDDAVADASLSVWAMFRQAEWGNQRRWWDQERAKHAERVAFNLRTFGQTTIPR